MMNIQDIQRYFLIVRSNKLFEAFIIFIIIFSALLAGAKTYSLSPQSHLIIFWLDQLITLIFLTELIIRFLAEPVKTQFFKQPWNIFDTLIVIVSLIPVDDTDLALVGRLIRIFRVLRMVSIIPELRVLLSSLIKALPQLSYVLVLMFIIFYIYAAIGSTFYNEINPVLWGDISISMLTLFRIMTFEDWTDIMYETMNVYGLSWIYYLTFIFFTAFAFLNMVIGIVVNVLHEEHDKAAQDGSSISNEQLHAKIVELEALLKQHRQSPSETANPIKD